MREIAIQEGFHTVSVYFPPEVVEQVIKHSAEGLTVVFKSADLTYDTSFVKEGEYTEQELHLLIVKARDTMIEYYNGEKELDDESW